MQMTAAVINAGLGDLSLVLEHSGFKVVAAYEADEKSAAIHRVNLNAPVFPLPFEEDGNRIGNRMMLWCYAVVCLLTWLYSGEKSISPMKL